MTRHVCILAYDVSSNKRRRKIVKLLEGVARRVQYSVFETYLPLGHLERLVSEISKMLDVHAGDSLLVIPLNADCASQRKYIGKQIIDWEEAYILS